MISQGSLPLWSPPATVRPLDPDTGTVYIDQNAARYPASPLEPLFRALLVENPGFSPGDVDLVTDRNNICKLLRFVQASSNDSFQILVEVVGNGDKATALFTRLEPKTVEVIQGFRGYGRNFGKAYTKVSAVGMKGYHRVVGYAFAGMRCVVRHKTDAYVGGSNNPKGAGDSLSNALGGLSLSGPEILKTASRLTVVRSGDAVDVAVSSMLEIKTRAASRTLDMAEVLPQLWISQTPKLAVGYHNRGVFNNVQVRDMAGEILRWETANQGHLGELAGLLAEIIRVVKRARDCRAVVEYTGGSTVRVVAGNGKPALPEDLYARWKTIATPEVKAAQEVREGKENEEALSLIPIGTPFASDMEYAIRKGPRQFFCRLPGHISDYRLICQRLKSLPPDTIDKVLNRRGFTYKDIMADFRRGKDEWDPDERREIKGLKAVARDAAFRLVYMLFSGEATAEDRNIAYNAVFFAVSHRRIFGARTRQIVRAAFEDRFSMTEKQRSMMDKFSKTWSVEDVNKGENETTEEECVGFDSDSDYY